VCRITADSGLFIDCCSVVVRAYRA